MLLTISHIIYRTIFFSKKIRDRQKSLEETGLLAEAYRRAFEEQLTRNRDLIGRLGQLTLAPPSKRDKAKATVKWLIKQLNEGLFKS